MTSNTIQTRRLRTHHLVELDPKPPILWTHGSEAVIVADSPPWEVGTPGRLEAIPGWPGKEVFPPQQMVWQIRSVLQRDRDAGGRAEMEIFERSGHFLPIDAAERWSAMFFAFLGSVE